MGVCDLVSSTKYSITLDTMSYFLDFINLQAVMHPLKKPTPIWQQPL